MINEWNIEALIRKGIKINEDGSLDICFFGKLIQRVPDIDTALRQQQHIIDQQKEEQRENEEIGLLMKQFHETICTLVKMTIEELTLQKAIVLKNKLLIILEIMSKKREDLRKDGFLRLQKVYKMIEKKNLPAANLASQASLDRMRRRWFVNEKVIDKSLNRLEALKQFKN
jgi:hypothetical protein